MLIEILNTFLLSLIIQNIYPVNGSHIEFLVWIFFILKIKKIFYCAIEMIFIV